VPRRYTDNANAYEFDAPVPCPLARCTATVALDTRGLSERAHAVRVLVEDAAGNERLVFSDDAFVVDNVVGAAASLPPLVAGSAQVGATLTGQPGVWRDALGEPRTSGCGATRSAQPVPRSRVPSRAVRRGGRRSGRRLRLRIDRVNAASEMTSATSEPTEPIARSGTAAADGAAGPSGATGSNGATGAAGTNGAGGPAGLTTTTTTTILVPNGTPAARDARLTLAFTRGGAAAQTVRWGKGATVAGG
jgi:hypothetical protein